MNDFYVNVVNRPEMVPEYLEKEASFGKEEDVTRKGAINEYLDIADSP